LDITPPPIKFFYKNFKNTREGNEKEMGGRAARAQSGSIYTTGARAIGEE